MTQTPTPTALAAAEKLRATIENAMILAASAQRQGDEAGQIEAVNSLVGKLALAFDAHTKEARDAEAADIVAWLADDASQTDSDLRGLHRRKLLTPKQTLEWEAQIAAKSGIASAIARHEHRKD